MTISIWKPELSVRSGNEFKTSMNFPAVGTLPNGGYVIGWNEADVLKFKVYNGSGETDGKVYFVDQAGIGPRQVNLRIQAIGNDGDFAVSWIAKGGGSKSDFKTRVFTVDDKGGFTGGDIKTVPAATEQFNDVANIEDAPNGAYVSTYKDNLKIFFEVHKANGERVKVEILGDSSSSKGPDVTRITDNKYVVTYYNGTNINYKIVDISTPQPTVTTVFTIDPVNTNTGVENQVVGLKDENGNLTGKFAIVRHQHNSPNLLATFYDVDGTKLNNGASALITSTFSSSGSGNTDLQLTALSGERIALIYRGQSAKAVLTVVDSAGNIEGQQELSQNTRNHPRVMEMKDGRLAISWADPTEGYGGIDMMIVDPRIKKVTVEGTERADVYHGTGFDFDILRGHGGDDKLYGSGGNDVLHGGAGKDLLDGGAGVGDMADYHGYVGDVVLQASLGKDFTNTADAEGDTYNSIENLNGSARNDILGGNAGANHIYGGDGLDRLYGGAGVAADTLEGGALWDIATYEYSKGGAGITLDLLNQGAANKSTGEAKGDVFIGIDAYGGTNYADTFIGANTYNEFLGYDGNDTLIGGAVADFLEGGNGDDVLRGGVGGDTMVGGSGTDFASYETATTGVTASLADRTQNTFEAAGDWYSRPDTAIEIEGLIGSAFNDTLIGNDGANTLEGALGNDSLRGNGGNDTVSYVRSNLGVRVDLVTKTGLGGHATGDTYDSIENVIGSNFNDTLIGDANVNILRGMDGNDVLIGGAGADVLDGGDGSDTVTYAGAGAGVTVNLTDASKNTGDAAGDSYASIENVIGSDHADVFIGNASVNVFQGGLGDDTYYVNAGDIVIENGYSGNDKVITDGSYTLGNNIQSLQGTGTGALVLTGNGLNNTIVGNDAGNWIDGGVGADTMMGGGGDDIYVVDNAGDVVEDFLGNNSVISTVQLNLNNLKGNFANITVAEGFNFDVQGTSGNNVLKGNAFANTLKGNGGNDKLYGMLGNDKLYGGTGKDTFVFDTRLNKTKNVDKVYDFKSKDDTFHLDNSFFTKLGSGTEARPKKFKSDMFVEGTRAQDREDRIVYDKKSGALYYDKDGTGGSAQVKFATISNKTKLYYHDFYVI